MRQLDRQRDKTKQTDGSLVALFNYFISRVRDQLHIVLAMSPIGDAFRNRLRKFPSLVNCCTIDWFQVRIRQMTWMIFFGMLWGHRHRQIHRHRQTYMKTTHCGWTHLEMLEMLEISRVLIRSSLIHFTCIGVSPLNLSCCGVTSQGKQLHCLQNRWNLI